jgi:SAM-dependent methyltransferase
MKKWLMDKLICPQCLEIPTPLELICRKEEYDDVTEGELRCRRCGGKFPIQYGIAMILPQKTQKILDRKNGYNAPDMLSAYMWSHFGDLLREERATNAYQTWSKNLKPTNGHALDIGCAVGRLTLEMTKTHDLIIGVDTSIAFIRQARKIVQSKCLDFNLTIEGHLTEPRHYNFNSDWNFDGVDFIVADAQALPFRQHDFATVAGINILEKVPNPIKHLLEVNRVLRPNRSKFLFSDPFSWDASVSPPENWLGGNGNGRIASRGIDTIRQLFNGENDVFKPPFTITEAGDVSWRIRKTENLWEYITSQFLVGERQ